MVRSKTAFLLGDYEMAWRIGNEIGPSYDRAIGPNWGTPTHAMLRVMICVERWPSSSPDERRRMRKEMRKHRAMALRWSKRCADNYQPYLDIIDGELLATKGRHEEAMTAFERAKATASGSRLTWLVALASERLAKMARRQGHAMLADAAYAAAREAYEAWGATAVLRRLAREHEG